MLQETNASPAVYTDFIQAWTEASCYRVSRTINQDQ